MPVPKVPTATASLRQYPPKQSYKSGPSRNRASVGTQSRQRFQSDVDEMPEVMIAVMGATGSGKSTFINLASDSELEVGYGLVSCTDRVQVAQPFELDGRRVRLIDTPGFDDTTRSDTDVLKLIASFLAVTYENGAKLAGVIYVHRISDIRVGGTSARNFKMFRKLCGESTLRNVIIVTSMWSQVEPDIGEAREAELESRGIFFAPVLNKGAQMMRHDNTRESAWKILRQIVRNRPLALRIQEELVDEHKDISETAAGEELNRELLEQVRRHREEMKKLKEEMKVAIEEQDQETRKELEEEYKKLHAEMLRTQADSERLASDYNSEKQKLERKMEEMRQETRQQLERQEKESKLKIQEYEARLLQSGNMASTERADIMRQLAGLQQQIERNRSGLGGFFSGIGHILDGLFGVLVF